MPEMSEDPLRSAIDAIRTRIHEELEAQLAQLSARQQQEVEAVRRAAEAEAEHRWASKVDEVRTEWTARLETELSAAHAEAERRMVAESTRIRGEAEQTAAESAAAVREELEQALARERERAEAAIAGERERLGAERDERQAALEGVRGELDGTRQERDSARQELDRLRQETESVRQELARVQQELEGARQDVATARAAGDTAQRELEALRSELTSAHHDLGIAREASEGRGKDLDTLRQQLEAAREQLAGESRDLATSRSELEIARRLRDEAVHAHQTLTSAVDQERRSREDDARRQVEASKAAQDARISERQAQLAVVERLLTAIRSMDGGRSLTDVLSLLATAAAAEAPRVALFVVNGAELRGWKTVGFAADAAMRAHIEEQGLLGEVMRRKEPVVTAAGAGPAAPAFAALPPDRAAIAVPLLVASQPVAILYADDAADGSPPSPASWPEAIQILGRHASVNLAHLTAARAAEVMRRSMAPAAGAAPAARPAQEDGTSARRYARLLVSEIKLYNEAAVRVGRQKRDLLERLKPEIERARKLYSQRISPTIDARASLFQQELVQTLADGDPSLLGNPA